MNLRTLKKLSKRAVPLLAALGDMGEIFLSERGDNYHGLVIKARKHWDRNRCHPTHKPRDEHQIVLTTQQGHRICMSAPSNPRKGTPMIGWVSVCETPEWDERCCWALLLELVHSHYTDWEALSDDIDAIPALTRDLSTPALTRDLSTPALVLAAARDMIAERSAARALIEGGANG